MEVARTTPMRWPELLPEERLLVVGRRRIALGEVERVWVETRSPDLRLSILGMLLGALMGVPAVNALAASDLRSPFAAVGIVSAAVLIFGGIFTLMGAADRYRVRFRLMDAGELVVVTGDGFAAAQLVEEIQRAGGGRISAGQAPDRTGR